MNNENVVPRRTKRSAWVFVDLGGPALSLVVVSFVSNLLMLTGPLFMLQVYDRVLASRSVPTLVALTVLVALLYGFYAFLDALRTRIATRSSNIFDRQLSARLFAANVRTKLVPSAAGLVNPVRDGDVLRQFLGGGGPLALLDFPWIPIYLWVVFMFHPILGWLAICGAIFITLLMIANEALSRAPSKRSSQEQGARQRQADDAASNAEAVIAMGMLGDLSRRWLAQNQKYLDAHRVAADRSTYFSSTTKGFRFLLQSGVLAMGAYLVIQGEMTGGLMIAASIITSRALAPVEQVVGQWRGFVGARQAWARIKKIMAANPKVDRETRLPLPKEKLVITQLGTGPQGARVPLLAGVNFELQAGEALGVLGPSGAGKSSLVKALSGVWPSVAGEVRLDGILLGHYDLDQIGEIIGYLPQRVELFNGTIAENISRFRPDVSSEDIIAAARAANTHELISSMPNGYDTVLGGQAGTISAGQAQRIGLARALFGDPFLVILDEPNANLDSEGDAALTDAIQHVRARGAIVIVVAHRPSAIVAVDKLLFLQAGRQGAFGPKNDVLAQITKNAGTNVRTMKASS